MTEKVELYPSRRNVYLVGKVKLRDDSFKIAQKATSGYVYSNANFGVETANGNVVYVEAMGGYSPTNPIIKTQNKAKDSIDVNWADRLNPKVVEQVNEYKLFKASLAENDAHTFLSQFDLIEYMKNNLKEGMEVVVRGQMRLSVYRGEPQRKIEVTGISLPYIKKDEEGKELPVEYRATFTQTLIIDADSLDITSEDEENGETLLKAYAVDYISKYEGEKINKNAMFPLVITVPIATERERKVTERLFTVEGEGASEISIEGLVVEGYDSSSTSSAEIELSEELQELVELGIYTLEEVKAKVTVRGNKVSKLVFTKPAIKKNEDGVVSILEEKEKYAQSDLFFYEQAINGEEPPKSDNTDSDEGESSSDDDQAWLSALGV